MTETTIKYVLADDEAGQRAVFIDGKFLTSVKDCLATAEGLANPDQLLPICDILNYLARGRDFLLIANPDEYRTKFIEQLESEDLSEPFNETKPKLSDFGMVDLAVIDSPRIVEDILVFYVSDDFTGMPYSVTCAWPPVDSTDLNYEPVPTVSVEE